MDRVLIEGLAIETVIGVLDWERQIKQRLVIDLELETDIRKAAKTDDLQYTLDYSAISDAVIKYTEASSFELIETLAQKLAELVLNNFAIASLKLKVSKPDAVSAAKNVAVMIERSAT